MRRSSAYTYRLAVSTGLLSVALIAFQLVLVQQLSITQWYHFAYMVISIAMLGFGAAGTFLALFRSRLLNAAEWLVPVLMALSGLAMVAAPWLANTPFVRFDSYLLFVERKQVVQLLATYLLYFLPFFLGALALGIVFVGRVKQIGLYYFANMGGSGLGGLLVVLVSWYFLPTELPAVIATLGILAGIVVLHANRLWWQAGFVGVAVAVVVLSLGVRQELKRSEYKGLSKTLDLPEAQITLETNSPYGLVQVVDAPALRYAPGLSLAYRGTIPVRMAVFNNGNWFGPIVGWSPRDTAHLLDYTTEGLPYAMAPREQVLLLEAGTGIALSHALANDVRKVEMVEPHEQVVRLLQTGLAATTDSLLFHPAVEVHTQHARTYLATTGEQYDLIHLPMLDAFGGTVGLRALSEEYTLTVESFRLMWEHLTPEGVVVVSSWMDYPPRTSLKILATLTALSRELGISKTGAHIAAVRSWGTVTYLLKRTPLTDTDTRAVRAFCDRYYFDPLLLPDLQREERDRYNAIEDSAFFGYVDRMMSGDRSFPGAYDFDIAPVTDNRPYFYQYLRWRTLPRLAEIYGSQGAPFLELGYLIVVLTLLQLTVLAVVLIILPLFRIGWSGPGKWWTLIYFSGLGIGYMFFEIVLIQKLVLYFGHPVHATAFVIGALLIFSGVGSLYSQRLQAGKKTLLPLVTGIVAVLVLFALTIGPVVDSTINLSLPAKVAMALVWTAIPGVLMGMPFPLGLRLCSAINEKQVPWAWSVNGCMSVISAALAMVLAVEFGFLTVMIGAAVAYAMILGPVYLLRGG